MIHLKKKLIDGELEITHWIVNDGFQQLIWINY